MRGKRREKAFPVGKNLHVVVVLERALIELAYAFVVLYRINQSFSFVHQYFICTPVSKYFVHSQTLTAWSPMRSRYLAIIMNAIA